MRTFTDAELKEKGFAILVQALGDVNAERFIFLNNCETGDYTRWRQNNLFAGESLDEVLDRAEQADHRAPTTMLSGARITCTSEKAYGKRLPAPVATHLWLKSFSRGMRSVLVLSGNEVL